jgi:Ca2+-binding RTX toxin-like protein
MPLASRHTEVLECRRLFASVAVTGGILRVFGDAGVDNVITVALTADKSTVVVTVNGNASNFAKSAVKRVRLFGDSGDDTISVDSSQTQFNVQVDGFGQGGNDTLTGGDERNNFYGGAGNDTLVLGSGRNTAYGEGGKDRIIGGDQRDFVSGGGGNDTIDGGDGRDQLQGDSNADTIRGGDGSDLIFGGRGDDWVSGGSHSDVVFGQDGNDTLFGDADKDELFGMAGVDSINGGGDRDTIWGGAATDFLSAGPGGGETHQSEMPGIRDFISEIIPKVGDSD